MSVMMCPLRQCPTKSRVRILSVEGGRTLQRRCHDMGLVPGSEVEVQVNYGGRLQVRSHGSSYAVGHGMAEKILVAAE